jgi:hypothetical protein
MDSRNRHLIRWGELKTERATWIPHWSELSTNILPRSGRFFVQDRNRGQKRHNNILDNTGTRAARVLAAGMMAGMTSPARPWFKLATPDAQLNKQAAVKLWLDDTTRMMLRIFAKSNTYRALHTGYEELGVFGTWATILLPDFGNVIHMHSLTAGEFAIAANWKGEIDTLYREFQCTVRQLVAEFGLEACTPSVQSMYRNGSLEKWVTVIHAIEPRSDRDPRKKDAKNMAWASCYSELGAPVGKYLRESGFKSFNALAPRWATSGGDIYGNSPGMDALGDIKQLQHEQLRKAQGIDYMSNPPLQVPVGSKNADVDTLPGGISYVDMAGAGTGIRTAFDVRLDLNHLLGDIQDVRERVRGAFSSDLFLMLANSTNTQMTATEVAERHEEKMLMLGPVLERLTAEMHVPLVNRTFDRMMETGIVPPPPQELHGMELNVEFVSMLAQAQRAVSTNGVDRFVGNLGVIAQMKPGLLDRFDEDAWADEYSDMLGVSPSLIVPMEKAALVRQQRAQAAQQQAAQEQAAQASQTAKNLAAVPTPGGNAASDVMNLFSGYTSPVGA